MATPAPLEQQQAVAEIPPPLPAGLEADLRAAIALLSKAPFSGKGHVNLRLDLATSKSATWALDVGGNGQERK